MRQRHTVATSFTSSFHHPALTTCSAPLPSGKKYVAVRYLTKEDLIFFVVDVKGKGKEVFEDACKYAGLQDVELFGLACIQEGEYIFIDPSLKISKYAVKTWKTSANGVGDNGQPLLVLYLRVKHYVDCHLLISEKVARNHYYLQLKENVKNYMQPISEERSFLLAALALQADLGNYNAQRHTGKYFEISNYFPSWIVVKIGEDFIVRNIPALHKDNVGLSRGEAQVSYIKEASDITAPHNLHFYKMRRRKGKTWSLVWLGIKDSGLNIYEQQSAVHVKLLLSTFLWCDIAKLHFEKKKFEILSEGSPDYRKFTYYVHSEDLAKHLLWLCRTSHHFHMANEVRVQDLKKLKLDGGKTYKENYIYTDKKDLALWEQQNLVNKDGVFTNINGDSRNYLSENGKGRTYRKESCNLKQGGHKLRGKSEHSLSSIKNRSMEILPLTNGCTLSSDVRYKSQSIASFPERFLTPSPNPNNITAPLWSPTSNSSLSTTPTSTLLSRSSCATDSACSSLSLASSSTVKASSSNIFSTVISQNKITDNNQWIKCDSFEELNFGESPHESKSLPHKVCISTFRDNHVRTASLYDAVAICSQNEPQLSKQQFKTPNTYIRTTSHESLSKVANPYVSQGQIFGQTYQKCTRKQSLKSTTPTSPLSNMNKNITKSTSNLFEQQSQRLLPVSRYYEQNTPTHNRTTTRIGISSLSREIRLPLSLYNGKGTMTACGSEPNLYNPLYEVDNNRQIPSPIIELPQNKPIHMRRPNSRSEMCLNVIGKNSTDIYQRQLDFHILDTGKQPSIAKDFSSSEKYLADNENFPYIPPPPAYRNSSENVMESGQYHTTPTFFEKKTVNMPSEIKTMEVQQKRNEHKELCTSLSSPPDVLDLQKLREKSRDLDLPLISALCNDRSLLMLPKTVPTCSRQRHLGNKDPLRFARGYSTTPVNGNVLDVLPKEVRPMSWHVETSSMWSNNVDAESNKNSTMCNGSPAIIDPRYKLPPTILTSFGKTPEKSTPRTENTYKSSDYRLNKMQMIPTKLLSGNFATGRLYQKGNSS